MKDSERRFRALVEASSEVLYTMSPDWSELRQLHSEGFLAETNEPSNQWLKKYIHPDDQPSVMAAIRETIQKKSIFELEHRVKREDGTWGYMFSRAVPLLDEQGEIEEWVGVASDVTERKRAEEALRLSLSEKEVLLQELNHRVKNNLQIIISLINLQNYEVEDPSIGEVLQDLANRVRSMALIHEQLYLSENTARVNFADYSRNLLRGLRHAQGIEVHGVELKLDLESVLVPVKKAVLCGLILNELLCNSLKYAFSGRDKGLISVELRSTAGKVSLRVQDNGVGLPLRVDIEKSTTLGLRLVHMLADQIEASVEVQREIGTTFTITFASSLI